MARYEWMTDEMIDAVKEALDKLSDVDLAIENVVDTIKYNVDTDNEKEEDEVDEVTDELSWDISGSVGDLMNRLEEMFGIDEW